MNRDIPKQYALNKLADHKQRLEARMDFVYQETLKHLEGAQCTFQECQYLGQGAAAEVKRVLFNDTEMALKVYGDLQKDRERADREVAAYEHLVQLQGRYIPQLIARGCLEPASQNPRHFVALSVVAGQHISLPLSQNTSAAAVASLGAIHQSGVLHGDIKASNILSTPTSVFLVDFERSIIDPDKDALETEMSALKRLLGMEK
ncbi:hypothetical protein VOLCADRAFT_98159 [Volvox carteri f. nagariensis]|uniref:Protein kinase domain-containing protein n=1 Tax=Volvox carteri f. nagariensis TaxID=3068 RepID=D8UEL5_VOLCA|nr:uncharacterized protein VOLCADRAFT_98159 [Volvox carteri f. nagariensis]EFJ41904.1 hypothetical protein VOLCADRAFT_98159 [Volvox carteri f. nagariensis]|eukprot:XP_002957102.1 hypothetical protein VOLCADRAFT_98159 [Volvox carteri f. nagariensis]